MSLKERTYSILVVSSTDSFASAFIGSLPEIRYYPVLTASSVSAAKRMLKEKSFDFVIINSPLSDDIGVRFAIDLCSSRQIAVLLLVKRDIHSDIHDKVAEYGVFTLPKPTSKPTLLQALSWMESSRGFGSDFSRPSIAFCSFSNASFTSSFTAFSPSFKTFSASFKASSRTVLLSCV